MFSYTAKSIAIISLLAIEGCRADVLGTATVNLALPQGTPSHLASGFIYGIPDTPNQIPDHFYTDMGFRYTRAGGSQLPEPIRGWVHGKNEFENRFKSALSNYKTARKYGARFQLLVADLWGADGTSQIAMPGDDGDWTSFDQFLDAAFDAMRAGEMTEGVDFEIWNEPDLSGVFWQRDEAQYLDMWARAYRRVRAALPHVPIIGPCTSSQPSTSNNWYKTYYPFVLKNDTVPDIYCWHEETGGDDVEIDVQNNAQALDQWGLPHKAVIVNEYGLPEEQVPGTSAWYISRLERHNVIGLRGNWASGYALHDYFGNLLGKPDATNDCRSSACNTTTGYWGNGEYNVYKYYNLNMTGKRVQTVGSKDNLFDVYATTASKKSVKILGGSRLKSGTWAIAIKGLGSFQLPSKGYVTVRTYQFPFTDGRFGNVPAAKDLGTKRLAYSGSQVILNVSPDETTAYAFELAF
ncbi:hypothetical protein ACHAPJ_008943 [Fusarium lateritium]